MANIKLRHKSVDLIPEHIRDNYTQFTSFLDAYHNWLELNQIDIKQAGDVDATDTRFLQYFKKETDSAGLTFQNIDDRFLIRHLKNIFLSKGTEESYRTLFKLMYGKDIIIKYPEQMCLKPSDGKWEQIISLFVEAEQGNALDMAVRIVKVISATNNQVISLTVDNVILRREGGGVSTIALSAGGTGYVNPTITFAGGNGTGATAHAVVTSGVITAILVDTPGHNYSEPPRITITDSAGTGAVVSAVRMFMSPSIYECNIDKHYYGTLNIGDSVQFGTFKGKILPTINTFEIKSPGKNFRLGQTFDIDTMFGRGATVKVSKLDANKGITEMKFIKFGYGYVSDFETSNIIPPNISQSQDTGGFIGMNGTFLDYAVVDPSGGYVLRETYTSTPGQEQYSYDYAGDIAREFYSSNKYNGDIANAATILFKLGAICKYPGNYINSDGMLSDDNKIQDSHLYQKYSYIIQVDEKLETYKDLVKTHIHPAGLAMFGEYNLRNDFNIGIKLTSLLSVFSIKHSDSAATIEAIAKTFGINVNDDKNNYLNRPLDWANTFNIVGYVGATPLYTKHVITKLFDFPNIDYADANVVPSGQAQLVATFTWTSSTAYTLNDVLQSGYNYYRVTTAGTVGTVPPTFTIGSAADGTATLTYVGTWYATNDLDIFWLQKELSDIETPVDNLLGLPNGQADSYNNFELLLGTLNSQTVSDTALAASVNSLTLGAATDPTPGRFNYNRLEIIGGPGIGQARTILATTKNLQLNSESPTLAGWGNTGNFTTATSPNRLNGMQATRFTLTNGMGSHSIYGYPTPVGQAFRKSIAIDVSGLTTKYIYWETGNGVCTYTWTGPTTISMVTSNSVGSYEILGNYQAILHAGSDNPTIGYRALYIGNGGAYSGDGQYFDVTRGQFVLGSVEIGYVKTLGVAALGAIIDSPWSSNMVPISTSIVDSNYWNKAAGFTGTFGASIGIDGTATADLLNLGSGTIGWDYYQTLNVISGFTYTISCYVKLGTATNFCVVVNNTINWNTVTRKEFVAADGLNSSTFTRVSLAFVAPTTGIVNIHYGRHSETLTAQTIGTAIVDAYQLEEGSTPSIYIKTSGFAILKPDTNSTYTIDDRDMFDLTYIEDNTRIQMDGPGLILGDPFDTTSIQDFDINIGVPLSKTSTVFVNGGITAADDTTAVADSGTVILNVYVNPLEQYVTGNYVHVPPDATF